MTRNKDEPRFLAVVGHLLRGAAVGVVAYGVLRVGWSVLTGEPAPLAWRMAAASLLTVPAVLLMLRAMVFPQERPGARVLLLESLALLALLVPFGFAFAAIQPIAAVSERAGAHPAESALMLTMAAAAWAVLRAVRRRAWRAGAMSVPDGIAETWREEMDRLAVSEFGRMPLVLGCLTLGLVLADIVAGLAIPAGWCGGLPGDNSFGPLMAFAVTSASHPDAVPRQRARTLVLVGFVGALAAEASVWLLVGCAGIAAWFGWPPRFVVDLAGGAIAFLVVYLYYLRVARNAETEEESGT